MIRCGWLGRAALMLLTLVCRPFNAVAQPNVGAGPLTSTLPEEEPPAGGIRIGRVLLAPMGCGYCRTSNSPPAPIECAMRCVAARILHKLQVTQ